MQELREIRLQWEDLSPAEQDKYIRKAHYLINYGYELVIKDSIQLAKNLYNKGLTSL